MIVAPCDTLRGVKVQFVFAFAAAMLCAQDRPLTSLPYTPSLEPAFMDRSIDPCIDFFRYSCGNWTKLNPIPPDQPGWHVYGKMAQENQQFLWGVLEEAAKPSVSRTPNEQKIGDFFGACMDEAAVEHSGTAPLKPALDAIAAIASPKDLPPVLARMHLWSARSNALFGFGSSQDFANSEQVIAFASAGGLGLPDRDYYTKTDGKSEETRTKYLEHVVHMFELLGDAPATAKTEAQTVMEIETALAKASLTQVELRDPHNQFHKVTRARLVEMAPSFGWAAYWNAIGQPAPAIVNVTEPAFYGEMEKQLKTRSIADLKTYLRWHAAHNRAPYLTAAFVTEDFNFFSKYLRGTKEPPPRWKRCVRLVDQNLGEAMGQVFVAKTFTGDLKGQALAMVKEIEKAMEADLKTISWMGEATRKKALEKLHAMVNKIGYPDRWRDYSSLRIDPGDFAGNVERSAEFESRRQLAKIGKPVDRREWFMTPPTVDAYYNPQTNDMNFPAGVLQPPLFDPKMDDAPNYGNTGGTIGHELTHGFDDEGRQFDAKGNLKDWWTKKDADEFVKRAACIADQYSQYTVVGDVKINGKLTLGEDVADLGGLILAYDAWKSATSKKKLEPIGGFTPEQRFFIGFAQWDCGEERPESKRANAITNPHSPEEYRINGVVSNMPEFAKAFSCKAGQPMVRSQACRVW
jgi:endothelin-converting enzyme/putative endopeptidase